MSKETGSSRGEWQRILRVHGVKNASELWESVANDAKNQPGMVRSIDALATCIDLANVDNAHFRKSVDHSSEGNRASHPFRSASVRPADPSVASPGIAAITRLGKNQAGGAPGHRRDAAT